MLKRSVASDGFLFVSHRKPVKGMILLASICIFCCYLVSFLLFFPTRDWYSAHSGYMGLLSEQRHGIRVDSSLHLIDKLPSDLLKGPNDSKLHWSCGSFQMCYYKPSLHCNCF